VGFSPVGEKQSILVYKTKNHYNEWEFTYSPQMDQQQMMGGSTGIGQPLNGQNPPPGGSPPPSQNPPPGGPPPPLQNPQQ
jgi:hypothetical protein